MKKSLFSLTSAIVALACVALFSAPSVLCAQSFLDQNVGLDSGAPFSPLQFSVDIPTTPDAAAVEPLTAEGCVAPVPASVAANPTEWGREGFELVAFLSVQTPVAQGWHIYTPTQGAGGAPTLFEKMKVAIEKKESDAFEIGDVRLATAPLFVKDPYDSTLEELFGRVEWIAPIYAKSAPSDLTTLEVSGEISALACSDGEGGVCVPQNVSFSVKYNADAAVEDVLAAIVRPQGNAAENADAQGDGAATQEKAGVVVEGAQKTKRGLFVLLLTAFLGGLVLNVTPCVLPVVGLKILSFFEQAGRSRASAFVLNVWYALGVLLVFGALAFASVGLSFLFTRSLFQIVMSAIVFAMALSLMGVWELQTPAFLGGERSNKLASKEGPAGAVFKGIITTLLAIPCGAPLLSPALDWASEMTRQGQTGLVVAVYLLIGLGMASPFLVAGAFPELLKFFPKPGEWMDTFRKTMGYFLLIAVVWILYSAPLEMQLPTLAFLFAIWFACWNIGRLQFEVENPGKKRVSWIVSSALLLVVALFSFNFPHNPVKTTLQSASAAKATRWAIRAQRDGALSQDHWALFDRATLDRELANGRCVAVDFTADWCVNCKFLEKTILHTPEVEAVFDRKNILTLTADWTNQDAQTPDVLAINELLDQCGARQVPTLMIFNPANPTAPIILKGLYSKGTLLEALQTIPDAE
ncbi:MAG: protein-disulfide reductase DsbD family protein [Thermoguttaceae bacterium]